MKRRTLKEVAQAGLVLGFLSTFFTKTLDI